MSEHDHIFEQAAGDDLPADAPIPGGPSLSDDVMALIDDGKTYLEAELQFQKSRASFVVDRSRSGATYGIVAVMLVHLALVALVVGALIALAPAIGAWGATGVVVGLLTVGGVLFALVAKSRFGQLSSAFSETGK